MWNERLMSGGDFAYLLARLGLAALSALAAVATLRFALGGAPRPRNWRLGVAGGVLLCIAACMSVQDALFNIVLRPHEPVPPESWVWLFCFDMLLPAWAFALVQAWRARERAEAELARLAATDPLTGRSTVAASSSAPPPRSPRRAAPASLSLS